MFFSDADTAGLSGDNAHVHSLLHLIDLSMTCLQTIRATIHMRLLPLHGACSVVRTFLHLLVDLADALLSACGTEDDLSCGQTAVSQSL